MKKRLVYRSVQIRAKAVATCSNDFRGQTGNIDVMQENEVGP